MARTTATPDSSNRLKRNLSLYSAGGVFLVSLIVALVSATPLYIKLKTGQEQNLHANLKTRLLAVHQALDRKIDIADQVNTRTRARQLLAGLHQGTVSRTEASEFNTKVLTEAVERADELAGVVRLDAQRRVIATVGIHPSIAVWPTLALSAIEPEVKGPVTLKGKPYLLIRKAITTTSGERVGEDIMVFGLSAFQEILADDSGLGTTGEVILAQRQGKTIQSFFPLRDGGQTLPEALVPWLEGAIAQSNAGLEHTPDAKVVAFEPVPHMDWAIAVQMERQELYASVHQDLIGVGISIFGLSVLATVGVVLSLRPLLNQVIAADELAKEVALKTSALEELKYTQVQLVQAEKMSSLGQLVAGIAHEINNPMNFIHGNLTHLDSSVQNLLDVIRFCLGKYSTIPPDLTEKLEETEFEYIEEDLSKMMQSMRVGSNRIRDIVLSLRNFSRLDESNLKPVNIHEGIDSTLLLLQNRVKPKPENPGIMIIKNYGEIPEVECYAGQLNQVFMNLLVNAIDALEEQMRDRSFDELKNNPATITITTEIAESNTIMIKLADNGPGISAEVRHKLFDPFFTTKPVGKGTGMGLSISQQIIHDNHQGKLSCYSTVDEGTIFIIELPLQQTLIGVG